ncbi:hypothetical protein BJ944DRAFT_271014 [Cunninghamella echinulata]|nr:hypothetical protein BJ944DRAFT_271014 [Cunninghamella echinulata]
MTTYTHSSYDIFVYKVLLPNLRTILLGLACIAIGCGSFLETNKITNDCTFHNTMSLFEVSIYQNISDRYAITPTSVTFGLWRQCYYFAQNCTCTPVTLNYQLDAQQTIFAATNNQTMPTLNPTTRFSYIKIIPLIMAISLTVIAFSFSLFTNYTIVQIKRTIVHIGFILSAIVALSIPYGWTIQTYKTAIVNACQAVDTQPVHCENMAVRLEIIILGVALGLLILSIFLICCGIHKLEDSSNNIQEIYIDEKTNSPSTSSPSSNNNNSNKNKRHSIMYNVQKISGFKSSSASQTSDYSSSSKTPYTTATDEALDAWNDVAMLDNHQEMLNTMPLRPPPVTTYGRRSHELYQESHMNYPNIYGDINNNNNNNNSNNNNNDNQHHHSYVYSNNNNKKSSSNNNNKHLLSSNTLGNTFTNTSSSSTSSNTNNDKYNNNQQQPYNSNNNSSYDLLPPTLPFVDNSQRRRRNSSQQHSPTSSSSPQLPRPASHASNNTFGANDILLSSDLPSSTLSFQNQMDYHHHHGDGSIRTTTPTSMTYRSERAASHGSICFTPTYSSNSNSNSSNPRNSSGFSYSRNNSQPHLYQQQDYQQHQMDYKRKNSTGSMMMVGNKSSSSSSSPHSSSTTSSSPSHHQQQQKYSHVPTLQSPPTSSSRHPLSNKVINDERIGAYFQQQ